MNIIESPSHYKIGEIECIDAIRSALSPEEFKGYCKGNIIKYIWREKHKNRVEDMNKAMQYLKWLVEFSESETK